MLTSVQTVIVSATLLKILHCIVHVQVLPGLNDRTGDLQSTCKILLVQKHLCVVFRLLRPCNSTSVITWKKKILKA